MLIARLLVFYHRLGDIDMARTKKLSTEEILAQFFLKSVGAEVGFWNASTSEFSEGFEDEPLYQGNVSCFQNAMKAGHTFDDLHHMIGSNYKNGVRTALASAIIPERKNDDLEESSNLLDSDNPYYHPALFSVSAPRFAVAGTMMIPVARGSTTPKDTFTLRELMDYYYANIKTACLSSRRPSQTKTMMWLLKQASLDQILYAIDAASLTDKEIPIIELTKYLEEADLEINYYKARSQ